MANKQIKKYSNSSVIKMQIKTVRQFISTQLTTIKKSEDTKDYQGREEPNIWEITFTTVLRLEPATL